VRAIVDPALWVNRRVFITGDTGFKGARSVSVLKRLGAPVTGYARPPLNEADVYHGAGVLSDFTQVVVATMKAAKPDIASEMAVGDNAEALAVAAIKLYEDPAERHSLRTLAQECVARDPFLEQFGAAARKILSTTRRSAQPEGDVDNAEEEVHRVSRVEAVCCAPAPSEGREHGI